MKKFSKIGKRVLAFFLVALMNINTYATTATNDGSSFVTKAEFDELMKDFNIKMNEYQSALNAKIDVAISSYIAGLSSETKLEQSSIMNNINPTFRNSWSPFETKIGTKYQWFLYLGCHFYNGTDNQWQAAEHKVSNDAGDYGSWKNVNTSDAGVYLRYSQDGSLLYPSAKVTTTMQSGCICVGFGNRYNMGSSARNHITMTNTTISTTKTEWGVESQTVNGKWGTTETTNASGIKMFNAADTIDSSYENGLFAHLAGTNIPDSDVFSILDADINKRGDKYQDVAATIGYKDTAGWYGYEETSAGHANFKISLYRHKYTTKKWTDFSHRAASYAYGSSVKFFNGCPMFTATDDGTATVTLKLTNTDKSATNLMMLSNAALSNVATTGSSTGLTNVVIDGKSGTLTPTDYTKFADATTIISFDAVKGKTYWIRILPSAGNVNVKSTKIEIVKNS